MMIAESTLNELEHGTLLERLEDALEDLAASERLWFLTVKEREGLDVALEQYRRIKRLQAEEEAHRLMDKYGIKPGGGLAALEQALRLRLRPWRDAASIYWVDERTLRYEMRRCRIEEARQRLDSPEIPWRAAGLVELVYFGRAIDPRIRTNVLPCPADVREPGAFCTWEFTLESAPVAETEAEQDVFRFSRSTP
ncbi:MAG: hypothetical protein HYZ26_11050 [Chloroflexi bacterium]|nr:hypothetical protein [Chloroflexota bacterium]